MKEKHNKKIRNKKEIEKKLQNNYREAKTAKAGKRTFRYSKNNMSMPQLNQSDKSQENNEEANRLMTIQKNNFKESSITEKQQVKGIKTVNSMDKKNFLVAKRLLGDSQYLYNPENFLKDNIHMTGNSRPTID